MLVENRSCTRCRDTEAEEAAAYKKEISYTTHFVLQSGTKIFDRIRYVRLRASNISYDRKIYRSSVMRI